MVQKTVRNSKRRIGKLYRHVQKARRLKKAARKTYHRSR